ncbi:MAG: hypothetical protein LBF59_03160, partial [Prevotellaceae bacterium]|nr:hypothetical protein [Prevotellaceae bacterium]
TVAAPNVLNPNTGEINIAGITGTFKYKYSMTSKCGTSTAIAYIHPLKDRFLRRTDTVAVCKDELRSRNININRILGLEINGGTWSYNPALNQYLKPFPISSSYSGTLVFDAYLAWQDAAFPTSVYHGDANAKKFSFTYNTSGSCVGGVFNKEIVIVVTEY